MRTLRASGDGISLVAMLSVDMVVRGWEDLTRDTRPTIRHVRVSDEQPDCVGPRCFLHELVDIPMEDATTLDIALSFSRCPAGLLWGDLKEVGLRLKTIRFEISEKFHPYGQSSDLSTFGWDSLWWDWIVELVKFRFECGLPLSAVERMVVTENEEVNRLQDLVWERFLEDKDIAKFLVPV